MCVAQILTAQKAGAKALVVSQTRVDPEPARVSNSEVFGPIVVNS